MRTPSYKKWKGAEELMTYDKKKFARVIATWVVTAVMVSVFLLDIVVVVLANRYVSGVAIENHDFGNVSGDDKIHFLNTANSDCIIIESNGHFALVDSGEGDENPRRKTEYKGYSQAVTDYIKKVASGKDNKINFDFIVATHMHYDHSGNMEKIIKNDMVSIERAYIKPYDTKNISDIDSENWGNAETHKKILSALNEKNIPVISELSDNEFDFYDFKIRFINTKTPDKFRKSGENCNSIGIIVSKGEKRAFLGADFTNTDGFEMHYAEEIGDVDLLKIGHHGYFGSSSSGFLRVLKPEITICTNYLGKIYPNVKWNLTMVAKAPVLSTAHRDGVIATFTDNDEILFTQKIM